MNLLKYFILTLFITIPTIKAFSGQPYMKYGKISDEEVNMKLCPFDSNASAVVLGDIGYTRFFITEEDVNVSFERHVRIKIFNKEAFYKGNFSFRLYKLSSGEEEKILSIKGHVYNLNNGKLEKSKLTNDNIFNDELDKNHDIVKVVMPDIKEGSIIELKYTMQSPFLFNLQPWYFQDDIPTVFSRYEAGIIEWYHYKNWIEGYINVDLQEEKKNEKFSFIQSAKITPGMNGGRTSSSTVELDAEVTYKTFTASNVPAFKDEPYITTPKDYLSAIRFELQSTRYPWTTNKNYTNTWRDINELLLRDEDFGVTLKSNGHLKGVSETIMAKTDDALQKAALSYEYIKNKIAWDGRYRTRAERSIRHAYNETKGNSADINLNLVALCRRTGLEAYPVLVSTRKHGKVRPGLVSLTQFNHVIAAVKLNNSYLLMDAIDRNCPYNLLPPQSLNGKGRLINKTEGEWVDLYSKVQRNELAMINLTFDENFNLTGTLSYKASDYGALQVRKMYKKEESEEDFVIEFEEKMDGVDISDLKIENLDSLHKPIVVKSSIKIEDGINKAGDMIFLNPKVVDKMVENVFKRQERVYPIDFNYPFKEQYMISIKLPEGYTFDEIPEPLVIALPENHGKYVFNIRTLGNTIQLTNQFAINQTLFPGTDYQGLKRFFEMIVTKEAEQVVIKKVN